VLYYVIHGARQLTGLTLGEMLHHHNPPAAK
jgi:hypothetical protein